MTYKKIVLARRIISNLGSFVGVRKEDYVLRQDGDNLLLTHEGDELVAAIKAAAKDLVELYEVDGGTSAIYFSAYNKMKFKRGSVRTITVRYADGGSQKFRLADVMAEGKAHELVGVLIKRTLEHPSINTKKGRLL